MRIYNYVFLISIGRDSLYNLKKNFIYLIKFYLKKWIFVKMHTKNFLYLIKINYVIKVK